MQNVIGLQIGDLRGSARVLLVALARNQNGVSAGFVHFDFGFLIGAEQSKGNQEHVQEAGVVGVLDCLLYTSRCV